MRYQEKWYDGSLCTKLFKNRVGDLLNLKVGIKYYQHHISMAQARRELQSLGALLEIIHLSLQQNLFFLSKGIGGNQFEVAT